MGRGGSSRVLSHQSIQTSALHKRAELAGLFLPLLFSPPLLWKALEKKNNQVEMDSARKPGRT